MKTAIKLGSLKHLWSQVPDDPDCWTFSLLDFSEFAPSNQDNPLFPDLKSEVLPTKKVAELLSIQPENIYEIKNIYGEEFIQGTDYFQNNRGHYLWTEKGVEKLSDFKNTLESKQKKTSSTPKQESSVRDKITKGLSKGHLTGLWKRVPKKVGVYRPNQT